MSAVQVHHLEVYSAHPD